MFCASDSLAIVRRGGTSATQGRCEWGQRVRICHRMGRHGLEPGYGGAGVVSGGVNFGKNRDWVPAASMQRIRRQESERADLEPIVRSELSDDASAIDIGGIFDAERVAA